MGDSADTGPRFGSYWNGRTVRFTLPAPHAERVELCLFDASGAREITRVDLERAERGVWSSIRDDLAPGQLYGYRAHGPYDPSQGHRFDPSKLLVDPAAPAVSGTVTWDPALRSIGPEAGARRLRHAGADSARFVPRSRVVDLAYEWRDDRRPAIPWNEALIYECHVRGATRRHPDVPSDIRGTYLGLAHPAFVEHLKALGVTTLELMPVHHFTAERHLAAGGRVNYWGYSPLGFYAPHAGYATGDDGRQVTEFRDMVRALHAAGIEIVIDVVLNHTCEGDALGPTLSLRGIDNRTFYRTDPETGDYVNWTGCGNTLRFGDETVDVFALDCLRYWAEHLRVDGFRFDLAPVLGRTDEAFDPAAPLLEAIASDPVLTRLKRIAEPWDLGHGGYRLGHFPAPWREWNDRFRDTARAFWRGDSGKEEELERRLAGSPDLFTGDATSPRSVNYIAAHDGFTLADLTSYEERHNEANGEGNRDGHHDNLSRNWGIEGPTDDPEILRLRNRAAKNLLATLLLADGTPMLGHGDELGRTQDGNNNAYCQDGPLTWVDWDLDARRADLLRFTRDLSHRRGETLQRAGNSHWEPFDADAGAEGLVCVWKPKAGLLLALWAGEVAQPIELPDPAAAWRLSWSSAPNPPAPREGILDLSPRSVTLLER